MRARGIWAGLLAAGVLAACGGDGDEDRAEKVVRDFVEATNERDPKVCDELVTVGFLERTTGGSKADAKKICKDQLRAVRGLDVKIESLDVREAGDGRATVAVELNANGAKQKRVLKLVEQEGDYRLDGATSD